MIENVKKRLPSPFMRTLILTFLFSFLSFILVEVFNPYIYFIFSPSSYLTFHNVAECFSVLVSFSIFGLGWFSYHQSKDNHVLFLSGLFLAIGLLDFMHTLSFPGMPDFISSNSTNKAILFWIAARIITSITFLSSAFIYSGNSRNWLKKEVLLGISLLISTVVLFIVSFSPSFLPIMFVEGRGLTLAKIYSEYFIVCSLLLAFIAYIRRYLISGDHTLVFYLSATIVCVFSELAFTLYKSAYDTYNLLGHIYKVIAFFILYRGIFISSIYSPYFMLKDTKNKLSRKNRELQALSLCNQVLVRSEKEPDLLNKICEVLVSVGGYRNVWVDYVENTDAKTVRPVAKAGYGGEDFNSFNFICGDSQRDLSGEAIQTGKTQKTYKNIDESSSEPLHTDVSQRGYCAFISLPLLDKEKVFGVLNIYSDEPNAFQEDEECILQELVNDLAYGVLNLRIHDAHQKAEEDLALLNFATNHAREAVFLTDEEGRLLFVNEEACRALEYTKEELLQMHVPDIDPDYPIGRLLQNLQILKLSKALTVESHHRTKSGKVFPVEVRQNFFEYSGKDYIFASAYDISERRRSLEEIKAAGLYNRSLIEASLDPLVAIGRNGKITDVNKATEDITGNTREMLIGTDFSNYFSDPQKAKIGYQKVFKFGFVRDYPLQIKNKDGKLIPVLYNATTLKDINNKVVGVFAAARDITERLQTESALLNSIERNQMAQAIGHVGNWEYNIKTTEFWGSDEAKRIYGFDLEQDSFTTEEVESCIPGKDWVHQALVDLIEKGKPYDLKFDIHPKHSTEPKIITSIAQLQKDQNGNPIKIVGVIQDITAREKLQEKSNRLIDIVNFSDDAIIGKTPDGIITSWNHGAERIYGYTEGEVIGRHVSILLPRGNKDDVSSILHHVKSGEHVDHYEAQRCKKDGTRIFVSLTVSPIFDAKGKVIAASTVARDITERRLNDAINSARMHLAHYAVDHLYKEVLEETINQAENLTNSVIGFFHFVADDQENLVLQNWSTRTKNEFCKAEGEGLHYSIKDAGVWVECFYARKPIIHNNYANLPNRKGMPEGHAEVIRELVVPVVRGDKITAILGVGNKPDNYDDNDVNAVFRIADLAWEIADRKRAEENIQQLNRELEDRVVERTSQLEIANKELEAFAYSVSHDLRAPLRHINGFLELLQKKINELLDNESKHYMDIISDSTKRMGMLIDDLLSFSRMSRFEMAKMEVNLDELVKGVIKDLETDMKGRMIKWEISKLPSVNGDRSMIRIVFDNLISNALKFTRPRKVAKIMIGFIPGSEAEHIIFVRDNGVGFDMAYADKLFGVFQRLHSMPDFEGTGIGLATVRRIINRHEGRTWAEGKEGQGATFYFSLPRDK